MPEAKRRLKERLGRFIHHPTSSLTVVVLILVSVSLVLAHLALHEDHPAQDPIEYVQLVITALFVIELSIKAYVAPSRLSFLGHYWIDIIAVIPWAQSLRVLRILRLLRVFRVALILSRRVRFVSALFRSAVGEYVVLGAVMLLLLAMGTVTLHVSELRAQERERAQQLADATRSLGDFEERLGLPVTFALPPPSPSEDERPPRLAALPAPHVLGERLAALEELIEEEAWDAGATLSELERRRLLVELEGIRSRAKGPPAPPGPEDLTSFENSFWATIFFLVATEPMVAVPTTTVGKAIVLVVMFGGLTAFAIFTGVVTALMVNRLKRRMEIDDMDRFLLNDHLIVCGWNRLVPLIIEEITETLGTAAGQVVVIAELDEPPPEVSGGAGPNVFFVRGDYTRPEVLEHARVRVARRAIVVADTTIPRSDQDRDARTVLAGLMIERMNPEIYTCAELLNRQNEPHLRAAGVEEVIVTTDAGGHHLAVAALHAGLADVLSELMSVKKGATLIKVPAPDGYVGQHFLEVLDRYKREHDAVVVGVEVNGQDGPRAEGYAMRVNPSLDVILGERDNLIVVAAAPGRA